MIDALQSTDPVVRRAAEIRRDDPALAAEIVRQSIHPISGLTPRHRAILDFITAYAAKHHGVSPTYDEIATSLGWSKSQVFYRVSQLEDRGFLARRHNCARSIKLISAPASTGPCHSLSGG